LIGNQYKYFKVIFKKGCVMRVIKVYIVLFTVFTLFLISKDTLADELPDTPEGFTWYAAKNGAGTFLQPDNWYVKEEIKDGTNALFISREKIKDAGRFLVGFSVNHLPSFSTKNLSMKPSQYAKQFVQKIIDKDEFLKAGVVKGGPSDMNIVRTLSNNSGVKTIVHHIVIGMDDKDAVYFISFEAPESDWEKLYPIASTMLNYFLF
jgi:hypothetical protein